MRRLIAILALCAALPVVVLVGVGASGDDGAGYEVRAIFDNVASAVPGEDVKVAGAKVGVIESMDVTDDKKAAVVLRIDDDRFTPFREDARCSVRPQSLIGEKFVECQPGTSKAAPLEKIEDGDGEGQYLLGVTTAAGGGTSSPVDLDLLNNIMRRPFAERFSILLAEFGTGLAGRGQELNEAINRANPALRETDRVLAILAKQNRVLANLARDSDAALAPLAREKRAVSGFIVQANRFGEATAERRGDIERGIQRLPRFLRELRPLMADLGGFAGDAAPVARGLNLAGNDVSRLIQQLGPFSRASTTALTSLGDTADVGRPALIRTRPLIRDLAAFGRDARPLSTDLDKVTASIDKTGGIDRLLDFVFFGVTAINGYDDIGHYLRAALLVNLCSTYAITPAAGCNANYTATRATSVATKADKDGIAKPPEKGKAGSVPPTGQVLGGILGRSGGPAAEEGRRNAQKIGERSKGGSPALEGSEEPALEYLLGRDGE